MKTHLDLCSGIGGFALAAQWSGYDTIGFCEIDPWCRRVLAKNFPGVPQHDDLWTLTGDLVRDWIGERNQRERVLADPESAGRSTQPGSVGVGETTRLRNPEGEGNVVGRASREERRPDGEREDGGTGNAPRLDLITGGYPCQPFSLAGKRLGAEDDRHLWPAIAALVDDLRPASCLFENVAGHITMGLDAVLSDLEALGYACWPVVIPAAAVGAPHRRDRVWIIAAHTDLDGEPVIAVDGDAGRGIVGAQDVADAAARGVRCGRASGQPGQSALGGEDVADADEQRSNGTGARGTGRDESANGGEVPANADCAGRQEQRGSVAIGSKHAAAECDCGRQTLGGMGLPTDGLPGWLVGPGRLNPWAGDWEGDIARTTTHEQDRTHKLKALGNAIVPQVAYEILRAWDQE